MTNTTTPQGAEAGKLVGGALGVNQKLNYTTPFNLPQLLQEIQSPLNPSQFAVILGLATYKQGLCASWFEYFLGPDAQSTFKSLRNQGFVIDCDLQQHAGCSVPEWVYILISFPPKPEPLSWSLPTGNKSGGPQPW